MSVDKNKLKDVTKETYKRKLVDLPTDVLKDIEGEVFTLYYHHHKKFEAPELGGHDLKTLMKLTRIVPQTDKFYAISSRISGEWQIWDSDSDVVHIKNAERMLSVINALLNGTDSEVKLLKKKTGLYIAIEGDKKNYFISKTTGTGKALLLSTLFEPRLGTMKTIDSVCEKINPDYDETDKDQKSYLKGFLKEINRGLKDVNAPIKFNLEFSDHSVSLIVKSGSS
jgi:hypothetical protein